MNVKESQLNYLTKRKKSYALKYGILRELIKNNVARRSNTRKRNIVELFGGVGLTTQIIQYYTNPNKHLICEIDNGCINKLKELAKNYELDVKKISAFDFKDYKNCDFVFIDPNSFTLKMMDNFEIIFSRIKRICNADIILTETGIFNLKFIKKTPEEHFKELNNALKKRHGYHIKEVYYTLNFSIIYLTTKKCDMQIHKFEKPWKSWGVFLLKDGKR